MSVQKPSEASGRLAFGDSIFDPILGIILSYSDRTANNNQYLLICKY